jgi:superfamily II DNA or RNA helicase
MEIGFDSGQGEPRMGLSARLAGQASAEVRQQGRLAFERRRVVILQGGPRKVRATVRGTSRGVVRLTRAARSLKVACSCSAYQHDRGLCEHIWASVLAAEEWGYLNGFGGSEPDYAEPDEDDPGDGPARRKAKPCKPANPAWKKSLARLSNRARQAPAPVGEAWPPGREVLYVVDATLTSTHGLTVELDVRQPKKDGDWSMPRPQRFGRAQIARLPDPADRVILSTLLGAREQGPYGYGYYPYAYDDAASRYQLSQPLVESLFPVLARTGRARLRLGPDDPILHELRWDEGGAYELWLVVGPDERAKNYLLRGELRRGEERVALTGPVLLLADGLVFWTDRVAPLRHFDSFDWVALLRKEEALKVPVAEGDDLLGEMLRLPTLPRLDLPEELRYEEVALAPRPRLLVKPPRERYYGRPRLRGELSFDYDGEVVPAEAPGRHRYQASQRRLILRDPKAESAAAERLAALNFKPATGYGAEPGLELAPQNLPKVVRTLLAEGWHVEAEGKLYRRPGDFQIGVTSNVDWFELHGSVDFDGRIAHLPELLAALRRGENCVRLDDGTFGMLPEEWLRKYGALAGLGEAEGDHLRFRRSQAGLLDALLAAQPEATCDAVFAHVRQELRSFAGVEPADPPPGFTGELRAYQRDGLGWLYFLQRFGFGGCLADDMGLGKTVQVLALLESRRALRAAGAEGAGPRPGPSLVVVPRSLVFNWKQEAARFTPQLRVLDHTGLDRARDASAFEASDVVLTTYGTLRRDISFLKDVAFDYCVLDEAQAIKNANSESAKAARLLGGEHRLALSGTPVENHLGELWSLFEFLNPGMLGSASVFQLTAGRSPDEETRALLARALRPFILRRTKEQVAKDLPAKTEQTIYCELEAAQRKRYDELRGFYRQSILQRVEREGIARSTMSILEALLRLRQAACHPGLIDASRAGESSAKLEALLAQLDELADEGHKVLVFSQFTTLLAIVRTRLDKAGVVYEYLDGRTRDRQARVERFQTDPDCKLFLISLKAGGLGLNLTAASYVYLLDPWWNPAVEAQAIDRAHRIGQERPVFAYRLIAKDTVEEKILELQRSKRELADAIINADNSLIRNLSRDDLELLLS